MPIYEYVCQDCDTKFAALRPMSKSDAPIACKKCESRHTSRVLSTFAAHSQGKAIAGAGGGCSCGSCSGGSCASCGN